MKIFLEVMKTGLSINFSKGGVDMQLQQKMLLYSGVPRGVFGGFNRPPPPPKFRG
jgi:hypothetical protein